MIVSVNQEPASDSFLSVVFTLCTMGVSSNRIDVI